MRRSSETHACIEGGMVMLTVVAGLSSALCYGISDLLAQRLARIMGVLGILRWIVPTTAVVVAPIALLVDGLPADGSQWRSVAYSAAAGVLYLGAFYGAFAALKVGDLSVVAPLISLQAAFVVAFAFVDGETIAALQAVGIALAVLGGLLVAVQGRASSAAGVGFALLAAVSWALTLLLFRYAGDITWLSQTAWSRTATVLVFIPFAALLRRYEAGKDVTPGERQPVNPRARAWCVVAGLVELVGLMAATIAVQLGPLAVAGVTVSQYATVAVLLGVVLLGERLRPHQLAGVVCTVVAVSMLSSVV